MKMRNIAVLLTCHNRKTKTIACLTSLFQANLPVDCKFDVFLTDDGSTDGTSEAVNELFPEIHVVKGDGGLFWAGGMRLAWETAMKKRLYDAYLLINDDVKLYPDFIMNLLKAESYSLAQTGNEGIYSGATMGNISGKATYGGSIFIDNKILVNMQLLEPKNYPQECMVTNANILWISKIVVDRLGIFDDRFTHGIADYDYSLQAFRKNLPVFLAPEFCGSCVDDHGNNWRNKRYRLKERIAYLKSPKGLAYSEYMYFIGKHFPMYLPYTFFMLWMKTLFPSIWDRLKRVS